MDEKPIVKIFSTPYFIASNRKLLKIVEKMIGEQVLILKILSCPGKQPSVWQELNLTEEDLKNYLKDTFRQKIESPLFEEWIDTHAGSGSLPAIYYIIDKLEEFIQ